MHKFVYHCKSLTEIYPIFHVWWIACPSGRCLPDGSLSPDLGGQRLHQHHRSGRAQRRRAQRSRRPQRGGQRRRQRRGHQEQEESHLLWSRSPARRPPRLSQTQVLRLNIPKDYIPDKWAADELYKYDLIDVSIDGTAANFFMLNQNKKKFNQINMRVCSNARKISGLWLMLVPSSWLDIFVYLYRVETGQIIWRKVHCFGKSIIIASGSKSLQQGLLSPSLEAHVC